MFKPFTTYSIEVDLDLEEVMVEAWDADHPADTFHARIPLEEALAALRRLSRDLRGW